MQAGLTLGHQTEVASLCFEPVLCIGAWCLDTQDAFKSGFSSTLFNNLVPYTGAMTESGDKGR